MENSGTEARTDVPQVLASFCSTFDCSLATVAEHITPKRQKARRLSLPLPLRALLLSPPPSSLLFCFLQRVQTDREPISHNNGCSQDGSKVKLTCSTLSRAKNRAHAGEAAR